METIRYPYKPKRWTMLLAGLIFAGAAVILVHMARANDRGLVINGIFSFDEAGATTVYWILAGASALFVAGALYGVARAFGPAQEVVIDSRGITAPKGGMAKAVVTVPFASITDLRVQHVQSQRFLHIRHRDGKLSINGAMLPRRADFETLVGQIESRFNASRAQ